MARGRRRRPFPRRWRAASRHILLRRCVAMVRRVRHLRRGVPVPLGLGRVGGHRQPGRLRPHTARPAFGRAARVLRPGHRRALRAPCGRAGRRRHPHDGGVPAGRLRRGRGGRRAAHGAAAAPPPGAVQGGGAAAVEEGTAPVAQPRGGGAAAAPVHGGRGRHPVDRAPLSPPGRDRHAVGRDDRPPVARRPHGHRATATRWPRSGSPSTSCPPTCGADSPSSDRTPPSSSGASRGACAAAPPRAAAQSA